MKRKVTIALAIIGLVLLLSGVTFAGLAAFRLSEGEPQVPSDIPSSLPSDYLAHVAGNASASSTAGMPLRFEPPQLIGNGTLPVSQGLTFFLVPYDRETNLTVYFEDVSAFDGRIEGSNATFTVLSPYNSSQRGSTADEPISFPDSIVPADEPAIPTTPWIALPFTLNEQQNHAWVIAQADVTVTYYQPVPVSGSDFQQHVLLEYTQQVQRDLVFFVVSPQEYHMLEQYDNWASISFGLGLPKMDRSVVVFAYSICALVGISAGGSLLYYTYKRR
jgi:hypothetical protein